MLIYHQIFDKTLSQIYIHLNITDYNVDDFFVRKYSATEPSSSFISGLHECGTGADCAAN